MVHNLIQVTKKVAKSWESHFIGIIGILIAANGYFVQRVISQIDVTTAEVSKLQQQMGRVEEKLEGLIHLRWKK